jgi:hypothetical protein
MKGAKIVSGVLHPSFREGISASLKLRGRAMPTKQGISAKSADTPTVQNYCILSSFPLMGAIIILHRAPMGSVAPPVPRPLKKGQFLRTSKAERVMPGGTAGGISSTQRTYCRFGARSYAPIVLAAMGTTQLE